MGLLRVFLSHHMLLVEAAIVQVVGIIEEVLRFIFLLIAETVSLRITMRWREPCLPRRIHRGDGCRGKTNSSPWRCEAGNGRKGDD